MINFIGIARSENGKRVGDVVWRDLTVDDAASVAPFYRAVVGWEIQPVAMEGDDEFGMKPGERMVAGVSHARGINAQLPFQWLLYVKVADIKRSLAAVSEQGGRPLTPVKPLGDARYAVVEAPAGAVRVLYQDQNSK